jgi:hypothetical protein
VRKFHLEPVQFEDSTSKLQNPVIVPGYKNFFL